MKASRLVAWLCLCLAWPALVRSEVPVRPVTAPEFRAALEAQRGSVLVLNFWATWCAPCLREIPELLAIETAFRDSGVRLIGVAIDDPTPGAVAVEAFRQRYFPGLVSYARVDGDIDALASVVDPAWNEVAPTTYVIDRAGRVVRRFQGRPPDAELLAALDEALRIVPGSGDRQRQSN